MRYANLKRVVDARVRAALGTDSFCGYGNFGENTLVEAERCALAGIPAPQILSMATRDAAEHLGADDLEAVIPGNLADLILVDGNPADNVSDLLKLWMVTKNGKVVAA